MRGKNSIIIISLVLYSVTVVLLSTFVFELRQKKEAPINNSLISSVINKINTDNYFVSRGSLIFGRTCLGFLVLILIIYILFTGLTTFSSMPYQAGFIIIIFVPVGLAAWVYLLSFDKTSQSLRRILAYFILLILSFSKSFNDFQVLIEIEEQNAVNDYLIFLLLTIFIAIDRLAKGIIDDYKDYKETKESNKDSIR